MSGNNLFWKPDTDYGSPLSNDLKEKLRDYFDLLGHQCIAGYTLCDADVGFLTGLRACGVKDTTKLIAAINKHERIMLTEAGQ
jgi:hypothetical protein